MSVHAWTYTVSHWRLVQQWVIAGGRGLPVWKGDICMRVGFHRLCCLWEAQRGDGDVYKIWNVHTGLIYGLHRSATTLKPLGENNIDHLVTMQCSVGKPGVLALMWIFWPCLQTFQIPIWSSFCDNPQDPMDLLPKSWCPTLQLSVVANPWLYHCCYNMSVQDKKKQQYH